MSIRKASHAGEWYSDVPQSLSEQLHHWLEEADVDHGPARAIIVPHAAYQFSGSCAAHAYKQIDPSIVKRVFILGPSHYKPLKTSALTKALKYRTPFYELQVDVQVNNDLETTGCFERMDLDADEKEHSIEMQLPFVAKVMEPYANEFTIVPILVGSLPGVEDEKRFAKILLGYLGDPRNLFVISSDFCHWGKRFNYTSYDYDSNKPIYQFIEELDKMGMDLIENLDPIGFRSYLDKEGNTICGRNPILILLQTANELKARRLGKPTLKFLNYCQSNQCLTFRDTSVSYASAYLTVE